MTGGINSIKRYIPWLKNWRTSCQPAHMELQMANIDGINFNQATCKERSTILETGCFLFRLNQMFPLWVSSRFMATNDLMSELQKDSIKLDDDSERKVVKMILKLLEDKNGEVQNLAVKWWVPNGAETHSKLIRLHCQYEMQLSHQFMLSWTILSCFYPSEWQSSLWEVQWTQIQCMTFEEKVVKWRRRKNWNVLNVVTDERQASCDLQVLCPNNLFHMTVTLGLLKGSSTSCTSGQVYTSPFHYSETTYPIGPADQLLQWGIATVSPLSHCRGAV